MPICGVWSYVTLYAPTMAHNYLRPQPWALEVLEVYKSSQCEGQRDGRNVPTTGAILPHSHTKSCLLTEPVLCHDISRPVHYDFAICHKKWAGCCCCPHLPPCLALQCNGNCYISLVKPTPFFFMTHLRWLFTLSLCFFLTHRVSPWLILADSWLYPVIYKPKYLPYIP